MSVFVGCHFVRFLLLCLVCCGSVLMCGWSDLLLCVMYVVHCLVSMMVVVIRGGQLVFVQVVLCCDGDFLLTSSPCSYCGI